MLLVNRYAFPHRWEAKPEGVLPPAEWKSSFVKKLARAQVFRTPQSGVLGWRAEKKRPYEILKGGER